MIMQASAAKRSHGNDMGTPPDTWEEARRRAVERLANGRPRFNTTVELTPEQLEAREHQLDVQQARAAMPRSDEAVRAYVAGDIDVSELERILDINLGLREP
jgi:hypothetical protein